MKIGDQTLETDVLVSKHVGEVMLGLDWLVAHNVQWQFGAGTIGINGQQFILHSKDDLDQCRRLIAVNDTVVQPHHETLIPAEFKLSGKSLKEDDERDWATEPLVGRGQLLVASTVLPKRSEELPVRVMNVSNEYIFLKRGSEVAEARPVEVQGILERDGEEQEKVSEYEHVDPLIEGISADATEEEKEKLKGILHEYVDVFSKSEYDIGCTDLAKHTIDTGDAKPIKQFLRKQPIIHVETIDTQVKEMIKSNVIVPSQSPWVSNVVIVRKKDNSFRFCVDYRPLNSVTRKDAYPLPRIDTCLDALSGSRYLSSFDLRSGYHNVLMDESDADKTSFVTRMGTYKFRVLPFGLCNAGATFQRVMDIAMAGLNFDICLVYLDDVILMSKTIPEHLERLKLVLNALRKAHLKLKPSKCKLLRERVSFLGHVVSKEGISTDPEKVKQILEWPVPKNLTEVRGFLGLAGYYRRFAEGFSAVAAPLHALTGKNVPFRWSTECQEAFDEIKRRLTTAPVLAMPQDDGMYILDTDASNYAIAGVLHQIQDGRERVIAYQSRLLSAQEKNYCTTRKELLAIVFYMKFYRQYLLGRHFKIRTDHAALQYLQKTPEPIGQQARWLDLIGEFDFEIEHRPGRSHGNADALSRKPCRQCGFSSDDNAEPSPPEELHVRAIHMDAVQEDPAHPWSSQSMATATVEDPELAVVLGWLKDPSGRPPWSAVLPMSKNIKNYWQQFDRLKEENGVIYRKWFSHQGKLLRWQTVLPKQFRQQCVELAHCGRTGGHLGRAKTCEQVQLRCYWTNWSQDVRNVLGMCERCVCFHRGNPPRQGPLQISNVGEPFEKISLDITGPHPVSKNGNRYILSVVDHFTKFAKGYAIRSHEAPTIAKVLCNQYFSTFGLPKSILTDNGKDFESNLMKELCKALEIDKLRTTFYKPSTNSACERWHRTLNSILAKSVEKSQRDWCEKLPDVVAAYNASPHTSTGYSPNFLVFGRENRAPLDLVLGIPRSEEEYFGSIDPWVYRQQKIQQEAYALARENLQTHAERTKDYYDVKVKPAQFKVGQWVYLYTPRRKLNLSPKWQSLFDGPYLIVQIMGPVNVRIQRSPKTKAQIVHIDKIKKVLGPTPKSWLRGEVSDGLRENGGGAEAARQENSHEHGLTQERMDLPSRIAQGMIPTGLADSVPSGVPETVARSPSPPRRPSPPPVASSPLSPPITNTDRPRREIRKPARYVDCVHAFGPNLRTNSDWRRTVSRYSALSCCPVEASKPANG